MLFCRHLFGVERRLPRARRQEHGAHHDFNLVPHEVHPLVNFGGAEPLAAAEDFEVVAEPGEVTARGAGARHAASSVGQREDHGPRVRRERRKVRRRKLFENDTHAHAQARKGRWKGEMAMRRSATIERAAAFYS